jgi:hypothetical protein
VYYADVAGFTCKEIAEIMDTPVGTVTSRLNRGRGRLRKLLADTARERGYDLELRKRSRGTFVEFNDPDLGPINVQAPVALLSESPGRIDHLGRALGTDNDAVYGELLDLPPEHIAALRENGTI